ncbi:hypothetical protein [Streptomyces sp. A1-5]|uniref:hypothetical protein n=1 Tax=Streptomyces sp. A1-5 TaxID=2738410 RepID=UPI002286C87F|nr:hypothetical protein [Streptomyces sp. A1-5]UJB39495.1 hypothetical protein HRD51_33870 [Streptomyces sp. A1-5]
MQPSEPPPADRDTPPEHPDPANPAALPAAFVRYAVALDAVELAWGYLHARLTAEDTVELAFLRRCDLGTDGIAFERIHRAGASVATGRTAELHAVCREIAPADEDGDGRDPERIWDYLAGCRRADHGDRTVTESRLAAGRAEFLLARAVPGRGMNWQEDSALLGTDRPEEVDAAFARGEERVGVAVIGLALTHPSPQAILPRVARTLERALAADDAGLRHQGIVALAHTARLHRTVDARSLALLRRCPRDTEADMDLWAYVPRRRLPWWLWWHRSVGRRWRAVRRRLRRRMRRRG